MTNVERARQIAERIAKNERPFGPVLKEAFSLLRECRRENDAEAVAILERATR